VSATDSPLEQNRDEFTRQARAMSVAPAFQDDRAIEPFVRLLGPPSGGPVLDLACGPGIVAAALGRAGHAVVGVDATTAMLQRARAKCGALFAAGAAERLPFADGSFAGAVTRLALHHFAEPRLALVELRRLLVRGAPLVVGDILSSADPAESALHNALETLRDPSHQRFLAEAELLALLERAGFAVESQERFAQQRTFEDWAAIVADARKLGPLEIVMRALAQAGLRAGIDLHAAGGRVTFALDFRFVRALAR
jgi:ubiquinone/menaquinone biosynthesis C-methylase UbiE